MNKYMIFALFCLLAVLSGCETTIQYSGTTCIVPDSERPQYNAELQMEYKSIDSSTYAMLKERGPKGSRGENEDIDDEYDGARKLAENAKEQIQQVIFQKHCVLVDEYVLSSGGNYQGRVNEFELSPKDTALFHAAKANRFQQFRR